LISEFIRNNPMKRSGKWSVHCLS